MKKFFIASAIIASAAFVATPAAFAHDNDFGAAAAGFALGAILAPPAVVYEQPPQVVYEYGQPRYGYYSRPAPPPRVYYYHDDDDGWHGHEYRERRWHRDHYHRWHHRDHDHR